MRGQQRFIIEDHSLLTETHTHTRGGWNSGGVGVSGHALLAKESDRLLTNKSQEEGQPLYHISSPSCLQPTGTY